MYQAQQHDSEGTAGRLEQLQQSECWVCRVFTSKGWEIYTVTVFTMEQCSQYLQQWAVCTLETGPEGKGSFIYLLDVQLLMLIENFKALTLNLRAEILFQVIFFPSHAFKHGCSLHTYAYAVLSWTVWPNYIALFNSLCTDSGWIIFRT